MFLQMEGFHFFVQYKNKSETLEIFKNCSNSVVKRKVPKSSYHCGKLPLCCEEAEGHELVSSKETRLRDSLEQEGLVWHKPVTPPAGTVAE